MAILADPIMEAMQIIRGTGWTWHEEPFRHSTVQSVYIDLPSGNSDLSPIMNSKRWSLVDMSKYHNPDNPEQYSISGHIVDEKLGCVFSISTNPYSAIIVPRDYTKTKHLNTRSIAEFFVNIIKKKVDSMAEIYLYSEYMEAKDEEKPQ